MTHFELQNQSNRRSVTAKIIICYFMRDRSHTQSTCIKGFRHLFPQISLGNSLFPGPRPVRNSLLNLTQYCLAFPRMTISSSLTGFLVGSRFVGPKTLLWFQVSPSDSWGCWEFRMFNLISSLEVRLCGLWSESWVAVRRRLFPEDKISVKDVHTQGGWHTPVISVFWRLRQKDHKF